ncbi:hypothetical protein EDD18DRAFT_1411176 [Armillaria luteobubalina]|uniref:Uncharacterized protein n=1 Tax=Armillaria luteobubalina TaxID=153913 RepID=A0AA39V359_9AGAR|nr:hypothetical protein EDD18DRAFT_1411176 [Armillaria luteobubalina]
MQGQVSQQYFPRNVNQFRRPVHLWYLTTGGQTFTTRMDDKTTTYEDGPINGTSEQILFVFDLSIVQQALPTSKKVRMSSFHDDYNGGDLDRGVKTTRSSRNKFCTTPASKKLLHSSVFSPRSQAVNSNGSWRKDKSRLEICSTAVFQSRPSQCATYGVWPYSLSLVIDYRKAVTTGSFNEIRGQGGDEGTSRRRDACGDHNQDSASSTSPIFASALGPGSPQVALRRALDSFDETARAFGLWVMRMRGEIKAWSVGYGFGG